MATDYDAPRRGDVDELSEDSLDELKARRAEAQSGTIDVDETEVGFVDDGGRLERVAGPLPAHVVMREPVQFVVENRDERVRRSIDVAVGHLRS